MPANLTRIYREAEAKFKAAVTREMMSSNSPDREIWNPYMVHLVIRKKKRPGSTGALP